MTATSEEESASKTNTATFRKNQVSEITLPKFCSFCMWVPITMRYRLNTLVFHSIPDVLWIVAPARVNAALTFDDHGDNFWHKGGQVQAPERGPILIFASRRETQF